jgi:hypothetical protein
MQYTSDDVRLGVNINIGVNARQLSLEGLGLYFGKNTSTCTNKCTQNCI